MEERLMNRWSIAASLVCVCVASCSDDTTNPSGPTGPGGGGQGGESTSSTSQGAAGAGAAGAGGTSAGPIPDPGTVMNGEWVDTEPNDTPDQAVPMGILTGPIWAGFVEPYTALNPEDDVDYFVFKTDADVTNVYMSLCWSFMGNLLDMNLYEVVGQAQGALVKASVSTASGCETLVDFVAAAKETKGSWWPDWSEWLRGHGDGTVEATGARVPGEGALPAIEPAPGRYVRQR